MRSVLTTLLVAMSVGVAGAVPPGAKSTNRLTGAHVEARTASVFAGPCHYNGELTTTGREAEMVWHVQDGSWDGVSLTELSALAAVTADKNLKDDSAVRRSVLYVDARASDAQANAFACALKAKYGKTLGTVLAVKRAPISFVQQGETFRVEAKGVTKLAVDAMPNHECCKMPSLVWYEPLVELSNRRVGYTRTSGIEDTALGSSWTYNGQNTAFYGTFTL